MSSHSRLDQRFALLAGGNRVAQPRQQTLSATIDWSYVLLSETQRRVFERLSVFANGWTLDAAEAVCAGDGVAAEDVLDAVLQLVRKSLVVRIDVRARHRAVRLARDACGSTRGTNCVNEGPNLPPLGNATPRTTRRWLPDSTLPGRRRSCRSRAKP